MNKKIITSVSAILLSLPVTILAFTPGSVPNAVPTLDVPGVIDIIFSILWPITVAFFIIMFVLAAFLFATAQGDAEKVKSARAAVIWGIVGVFVALVAFSIVFIVRNLLPGV